MIIIIINTKMDSHELAQCHRERTKYIENVIMNFLCGLQPAQRVKSYEQFF